MNDYASTSNSAGLLKKDYQPDDEAMEALRRRQQAMAARVKASSQDPKQDTDE